MSSPSAQPQPGAPPPVLAHRFGALSPALAVAAGVVVTTGLVIVAALAGSVALVPTVLALGLLLAWGWPGTLGTASPRGSELVLVFAALAITGSVSGWGSLSGLRWLAVGAAVSVLAVLLHQLLRRDGRPRLAESASGNLLGVTVLTSGACLVESVRLGLVGSFLVALLAGASAALVELLGRWRRMRVWVAPLALLGGAGVGVAGNAVYGSVSGDLLAAIAVGVLAAAVATALRTVLSTLPALAHARPRVSAAVASVLVVGVVPLLVTWLAGEGLRL